MEGDFYKCEEMAFSEGISSSAATDCLSHQCMPDAIFSIWGPNGSVSNQSMYE